MGEIHDLVQLFGPISGLLLVALAVVWREWRKSEAEKMDQLEKRIAERDQAIKDYQSFKDVINNLSEVIKQV